MKTTIYTLIVSALVFVALIAAFWGGMKVQSGVEELRVRTQVLAGPYSDNFQPALTAIAAAKDKLKRGDTNIMEELNVSQHHIEKALAWAEWFATGEPNGPANRSQPVSTGTNRASAAAGSGR